MHASDRDFILGRIHPHGSKQLLGPWPEPIFVVLSLAPEHIVKTGNFDSQSVYQPIDEHWSDTYVDATSMCWDSLTCFMLSSVLNLLMTFTRCCSGLIKCSIHLDESAPHVLKAAQLSHLCVFLLISWTICLTVLITDAWCMVLEASLLIAGAGIKMTLVTLAAWRFLSYKYLHHYAMTII
jgi:hypothetical protein